MSELRIIIAGGGTGGHLFPALAIGDELKSRGIDVMYMGSTYGIEAKQLKERNEKRRLLNIRGIQRSLSLASMGQNLLFPFKFIMGYIESIITILKFNPQVVVGTGGYASGLPLLAALLLKKKTLLQEQNSFPGITTRKLSHKVDRICIAYESAQGYLKKNAMLTGNPIRKDLNLTNRNEACTKLGLNPNKPVIFILGGSQGSHPFNVHFSTVYNEYVEKDIQLLWQTGVNDIDWLQAEIDHPNVKLTPFIHQMGDAYSVADIVISRAGALAIEELKSCGKAMVLIPFPLAAADHQTENARSLSIENAAICINQTEMNDGFLETTIIELFKNEQKLKSLKENAKRLSFPNALTEISDQIMELAHA
ncbi:MAG: undecaprenyldiphospho-muramoylpentapeptide beta-N-acetylglucosaminyltransferase [Candidatus Marinimicrobia bacterium]|nr:undecaprenyldiphospho-muramoylpentapeptide beta-N-acetylglucosaminyltransferase [Candidatus Neomarinimicrobiota bacterium]